MSNLPKTGALTEAELLDVWKGALDRSYRNPILLAGEGNGLEAHTQMLAQFARVSRAIDKTTQEMFICPWSGQTGEPSGSESAAVVVLTFRRTLLVDRPLVLAAGTIVEEQTTDWGGNGGVEITTGRRYRLVRDLVFHPGDLGPFDVEAVAEKVGEGYNNPRAGTIRLISQPGYNFENDLATVIAQPGMISGTALAASSNVVVTTPNEPDTFVPEHVGQYVQFVAGNNVGKIARITQFTGPNLLALPPIGSSVVVATDYAVQGTTVGTFEVGETVTVGSVDLFGRVLGFRDVGGGTTRLTFAFLARDVLLPAIGTVLVGGTSGATLTVTLVLQGTDSDFVSEAPVGIVGGASWRILAWSAWGLTVTNVLAPSGGRIGWLDELGSERSLSRAPGEDDATYRQRIKSIADVVTPNAIRRTLSRTLVTFPWCFREVGTEYLPGFFFDGDLSIPGFVAHGPLNDAYDYDSIILTGGPIVGGPFEFQEVVEVEDAVSGDNYATGWFGRLDGGTTLTLIRKDGALPNPFPVNVRVRGTVSGALFPVTADVVNPARSSRRFHVFLDYSQFRGFFLVCLPPLGIGEFGFAYGDHPANAYDAPSPYETFFDGYPYLNSLVYGRVYQAIDQVRAGGVLFDLCLDDGSCP